MCDVLQQRWHVSPGLGFGVRVLRGWPALRFPSRSYRYEIPAAALRDPKLKQSRDAKYGQTTEGGYDLPHRASARNERHQSRSNGEGAPTGAINVADPVHQIQKRPFRLSARLTLNGDVSLWRRRIVGQLYRPPQALAVFVWRSAQ